MSRTEPTETLIEAANAGRSVGDVTVLADVSLDVADRNVTVVVGPNGSGKTSLLRLLVGLDPPTSGRVTRHVADDSRGVGYLPQDLRFRPTATVAETLDDYATLAGASDASADLSARVGLAGAADRRIADLSGGMVRLLGVAVALAGDPAVVALDEPTSGLDPRMTDRVFDVVADVSAERSVVLTTHDLGVVPDADRVVVLDGGRVAANDAPDALFERTETDDPHALFRALVGDAAVTQTRGGE